MLRRIFGKNCSMASINAAFLGTLASSASSNFYCGYDFAKLIMESFLNKSLEDPENENIAIYVGGVLAICALGSAITDRELNIYMHSSVPESDIEQPLARSDNVDPDPSLPPLTRSQMLVLACLALTYTGDVSGAIMAGFDLLTAQVLKVSVSKTTRAMTQCASILFATGSTVAGVKSCKVAIQKNAAKKSDTQIPAPANRGSSINRPK